MSAAFQRFDGSATEGAEALPSNFKLLIVDDDVTVVSGLGRALSQFGQVRFATNGPDALRMARHTVPDLILLDVEMPAMSGLEVCSELKKDAKLRDVPVIFVTAHNSLEEEIEGFALGAADFISKPPHVPLVVARVRTQLRMKQLADELRRLARTDGLTGLPNRREFDEVLRREWSRAVRARSALSLLIIDVDHFKSYNDFYGHPAGDTCLKSISEALARVVRRPSDLLARYGGEEFAALLPETDVEGAGTVARRLLEELDSFGLLHEKSSVASHVTVSVGLSSISGAGPQRRPLSLSPEPLDGRCCTDLVQAADEALYSAKAAGRRRAHYLSLDDLGRAGLARDIEDARPVDGVSRLSG
jgi:diguanylate cyclase (GGDEF)-like protein